MVYDDFGYTAECQLMGSHASFTGDDSSQRRGGGPLGGGPFGEYVIFLGAVEALLMRCDASSKVFVLGVARSVANVAVRWSVCAFIRLRRQEWRHIEGNMMGCWCLARGKRVNGCCVEVAAADGG